MRFSNIIFSGLLLSMMGVSCKTPQTMVSEGSYDCWVTTMDKSMLFKKIASTKNPPTLLGSLDTAGLDVIAIDTTKKFQTMDGFGFALTGGSAMLIHNLPTARRDSLLKSLFLADGDNIGISTLRISIGASDLDDHPFTYDDLPQGETDASLLKFSIDADRKHLIPVLKEILALNPSIQIMGSPWSAPAWMKTNNNLKGGNLKPEYYEAFAQYFVKYLKAMAAEGISIHAVTLQNEPENPKNNPSMVMTAADQANFVKENLGPAFQKAGLKTKIIVFDHNCDHPEYPIAVLNDQDARHYIDGAAFHLYLGDIEAMNKTHEAHPDKNVYFTEQWTSSKGDFDNDLSWHVRNLIIGAPRNWSKGVIEWNLASDPQFNPHTDSGGCSMCMGALTIGNNIQRNVSYYIIGHASKFVRPGSIRIASTTSDDLPNVVYQTPEGKKVLIAVNDTRQSKTFKILCNKKETLATLPAGAVGTFVW